MANTVIALKKSATPNSAPVSLANGELAINFSDGVLYYKHANGSIASISGAGGGNSFGTVNANNTLVVADTPGDILTLVSGNNISIVGDAVNDKITVGLTNDVAVSGLLSVTAASGDEGGEIRLANAITNSLLAGPVNIDIFQNQLRFFVAGGDARGAFINLAATSAGVGTDLLAAASSTTDTFARATASQAFDKANAALPNVSGTWFNGTLTASANLIADKVLSSNNGYGENFRLGDDAWIGDTNVANAFRIKGQQNASIGYVMFGPNDGKLLGRAGTDSLTYDGNIIWHAGNSANASQAFDRANTANITADRAWNHANAAFANGNTVIQTAQSAFTQANLAFIHANNAFASANAGQASANAGQSTANAAFVRANTANITADRAWNHANAAFATANVAFANANTVMISAQASFTVANSSFLHANSGYAFSNSAHSIANLAFAHANNAYLQANAAASIANTKLAIAGGTITGNLSVVGSLTISGNTYVVDGQNLRISDPLIYLAGNNYVSDIVDIGFIGNYVNATGQNVHTGLYREHLDKEYYLFQGYDAEPINNHIGALSNNMTLAVLNAVVKTSNLILGGANAILTIGAAFNQANAARTVVTDTVSANRFLVFANGTSGTFSSANVTTGLTFNPASNTLTTGSIILSGTGNPLIGTVQSNSNFSAGLVIRKRGNPSDIDGSVLSGAELGYNSFFGWNGDGFVRGAYIIARTSEDWNNTNRGSRLSFATTDIGSNVNVERVTIDPAGNVLIGRTISTVGQNVKLDVNGAVNASALFVTGNVGIGTSSPAAKLDVSGTGIVQARVRSSSTDGSNLAIFSTDYGNGSTLQLRAAPNYLYLLGYTPTSAPLYITSNSQYGIMMTMNHTGYVGIGTTAPSSILEVSGDAVNSLSNLGTGDNATITITNTNVGGLNRIAKTLYEIGNLPIASVAAAYTVFNAGSNIGGDLIFSTQRHVGTGVQERMRVDSAGNVFIGRTDSTVGQNVKLDVNGAINASAVLVNGTPLTSGSQSNTFTSNVVISVADNTNAALRITQTGTGDAIRVEDDTNPDSTPFIIGPTGNVGIGISPDFPLHIALETGQTNILVDSYGTGVSGSSQLIGRRAGGTRTSPTATPANGAMLFLGARGHNGSSFATTSAAAVGIFAAEDWTSTAAGTYIDFRTTSIGTTTTSVRMIINANGNVGIGTTSPDAKLAVVGSGQGLNFNTAGPLEGSILVGDSGTAAQNGGSIVFSAFSEAWKFAAIKSHVVNGGSNTAGDIAVLTRRSIADPTLTETARFQYSGNVLIGRAGVDSTVGQNVKLDVNGAVNASAVLVNGTAITPGISTGKAIAMAIVFG